MANKPVKKRTTKKATVTLSWKQKLGSVLLSTLWKGALATFVAVGLYVIYLDAKVSRQFEGNKWQLPVQVYARAMGFYPDQYLSQEEVVWELNRLNYSQVNVISRTGQYVKKHNTISVFRRAFEFYDGQEAATRFTLVFSAQRLEKIVDEQGNSLRFSRLEPVQIARIGNESQQDREFLPLEKFPKILRDTLLTVEDRNFYEHHGVSLMSIMRALYTNIRAGRTVQGGSTLTQQLAKNFYLTRERSIVRKINEAFIALILDFRYSKDEILEAYLNEVYLGQAHNQGVHGMGLASEFYFAKPVDELEFDQMAMLIAMVKGPSYYNPRRYPERTLERRDIVLRLMVENGIITTNEFRQALARPIKVQPLKKSFHDAYPGYLELVRRELDKRIADEDIINAGVRVFTYFELQKQDAMEDAVLRGLEHLEKRSGVANLETAMVSVNLAKGGVSALVAGRDLRFSGYNRVLDSKRTIGSLVKPAVYLTALQDNDVHLATPLSDSPLSISDAKGETWKPENFDRQYRGEMPLYQAFAESINLPAVHLGLQLGVDSVAATLTKLGIDEPISRYPSLFLGAQALSSFDIAQMYSTLANDGVYKALTSISAITNATGTVLYEHQPSPELRFDKDAAYMTKYALKRVTKDGTAKRLNAHFPSLVLAGKTGTSNDLRDSWYAGFDHNTVTVTWVGRDDNKSTGLTGAVGALELYIRYLKPLNPEAIADTRPDSIRWAFVDVDTGRQAPPGCGNVKQLPIRAELFDPKPRCRR
ncbi:Multimodular transpeptidase-transglycosylase [Pseudoalteromonas luteoviolacea B = ATCC 29581]|nr:Multimodular transpeptidase-transglycosylase [Pseudoalteromonas luteoviolacea B = ATCC 29581]